MRFKPDIIYLIPPLGDRKYNLLFKSDNPYRTEKFQSGCYLKIKKLKFDNHTKASDIQMIEFNNGTFEEILEQSKNVAAYLKAELKVDIWG